MCNAPNGDEHMEKSHAVRCASRSRPRSGSVCGATPVPTNTWGVDRSCDGGRQDGGAEIETKLRSPQTTAGLGLVKVSASLKLEIQVKGCGMRRILNIVAGMLVFLASPWWLLNGEPRPQCAMRPTVTSTWKRAMRCDVLLEADNAAALCHASWMGTLW